MDMTNARQHKVLMTKLGKASHGKARQGKAWQSRPRHVNAGQNKAMKMCVWFSKQGNRKQCQAMELHGKARRGTKGKEREQNARIGNSGKGKEKSKGVESEGDG